MENQLTAPRTVKIWTTVGGTKDIQSSATTWGQLKQEVEGAGFSTDNMKVVHGVNQNVYETPGAIVDPNAFTLFLMPKKTKSGGNERGQVQEILSRLSGKDLDKAKALFNEGRNYTQKKGSELEKLIVKWSKKNPNPLSTSTGVAPTQPKRPASPVSNKIDAPKSGQVTTQGLLQQAQNSLLAIPEPTPQILKVIADLGSIIGGKKAPKDEKKELARQAAVLAAQFSDVRDVEGAEDDEDDF